MGDRQVKLRRGGKETQEQDNENKSGQPAIPAQANAREGQEREGYARHYAYLGLFDEQAPLERDQCQVKNIQLRREH